MSWKYSLFLIFVITLTGCNVKKQTLTFNKAIEIKDIPDNFFSENATGELSIKFFELRKVIPGRPSLYLYNQWTILDSAYMFEIKSYNERTDSNYFFIAKYKSPEWIGKPAKCLLIRWKNYPGEYRIFSDTASVLTNLEYGQFMKLYPAFKGKVKTAHFREIRFSDNFQNTFANYIFTFH
ncbi:MAG: hypothetical protein ACM34K_17270 [Bacillota bacterium]